jgi:hypothetical protein
LARYLPRQRCALCQAKLNKGWLLAYWVNANGGIWRDIRDSRNLAQGDCLVGGAPAGYDANLCQQVAHNEAGLAQVIDEFSYRAIAGSGNDPAEFLLHIEPP